MLRRGAYGWIAALLVAACLAVGAVGPSDNVPGPRGADAYDGDEPRVEAELVIDAEELRPGQEVRVGVHFRLDPGWHVYWRNSGESGLPTELEWDFPQAAVGPIRWPAPEVFEESDGFLTTYGYEDQVLLTNRATLFASPLGIARVSVIADFVTCRIGCIPGRIELSRELRISEAGRPASREVQELFESWEQRLPRSSEELGLRVEAVHSRSAIRPGDSFETAIEVSCLQAGEPGCSGLRLAAERAVTAFLPELVPTVELEAVAHADRGRDGFALVIAGRATPDDPGRSMQRLRGLIPVTFSPGGSSVHLEVDVPLPRAFAGEVVGAVDNPLFGRSGGFEPLVPSLSLLYAIGLALLGGLILNLMPCVLPILAIKVFHVAELAHESRRDVHRHGMAYTGGVLASMALLAGVVVLLRAAGTAVGWGFQFQEPIFIAGISTLLVVFALNLFGVFEVTFQPAGAARLGAQSTGLRRSFFEGLLAVVLATPCTAPFLGTAVGFAFASSPLVIFAMFLAIGVGLAAPYAAISLVPAWAKLLPRPGPWMLQVRRVLGFSLIGTVVWLLWVVGRSVGIDAQAMLLGYLVVIAFLVWVFGAVQNSPRRPLVAGTGLVCTGIAVLGMTGLSLEPIVDAPRPLAGDASPADLAEQSWRSYDMAAIQAELERGRPVFVDFTADWCITCKVNESVVLQDSRVKAELSRLAVATFKADWTLYDDEIRRVLASFGKAGVPMYLVYRPDAPARPAVLPELLTVDIVLEALREAVAASGA